MEYGASIEGLTEEQLNIICIKTVNDDALPVGSISPEVGVSTNKLKEYVEQKYNGYLQQYLRYYIEKPRKIRQLRMSWEMIFNDRKTEALYLWFVFMNKPDMAKYLCSRSRESETSNPYHPVVPYRSTSKNNESNRLKTGSMLDRIKWFYEAPMVRFYYNFIFFVLFLALFSYVLLVDYFPLNVYGETRSGIRSLPIPVTEIILHICIVSLAIDEIYQMKDALLIFFCFILVILFGFSVASWSLLTTKHQVIWPNTTNESFSSTTVKVENDDERWSWQLFRDVFNWGLWKVFGQVAEPFNDAVSDVLSEQVPLVIISGVTTNDHFSDINTDESGEQVPLIANSAIVAPDPLSAVNNVDTRQMNREKVIAETYWQDLFDEENQKKTLNKENNDTATIIQSYADQTPLSASIQV
ncbi:unnamed protein product [Adineta steineri]|uniref:Uncharacterized protein n=1 Tax=Adineta steineri TaxID=433720 RepID=A0A819ETN0_9BILA|nr:unnamed protein product [Adineta steineri]